MCGKHTVYYSNDHVEVCIYTEHLSYASLYVCSPFQLLRGLRRYCSAIKLSRKGKIAGRRRCQLDLAQREDVLLALAAGYSNALSMSALIPTQPLLWWALALVNASYCKKTEVLNLRSACNAI